MEPSRRHFRIFGFIVWMTVLVLVALAWPVTSFCHTSIGIVLENTPAFGWQFDSRIYTECPGWGVGVDGGYFVAFKYRPVPNPMPLATGPSVTFYDVDWSQWVGRRTWGVGTLLTGSPRQLWWTARTGTIFNFLPVSLLAVLVLARSIWHTGRKIRSGIRANSSLCPTCSYDLRAHHPGDKCPECGTPITPKP